MVVLILVVKLILYLKKYFKELSSMKLLNNLRTYIEFLEGHKVTTGLVRVQRSCLGVFIYISNLKYVAF